MFTPLRRRLALVNAAIIAAVVVAIAAGILIFMDRVLMDQQRSELDETARAALARLEASDAEQPLQAGTEEGGFYVVWDTAGRATSNAAGVPLAPLAPLASAALRSGVATSTVDLGSVETLVESLPVEQGGRVVGALQAGRSLQPVRDVEGQMALLVLSAGGVGLLLSLAGGWILAERSLVPIRRAFQRQQEFAADASHEMRTPLSIVDAGLQVLRRHPELPLTANADVVDSMAEQVAEMEDLVSGLLTLARADAGMAEIAPRDVDLDALVRETVESIQPLAASRAASLTADRLASGRAIVDPDRIRQLVTILVQNALVHGGRGVSVAVRTSPGRSGAILEVADDGPGIAAAERSRVLERFYRAERARSTSGTGLGLAIADWIVKAHGGRLELRDNPAPARPDRPGLLVRVSIPPGLVPDAAASGRPGWPPTAGGPAAPPGRAPEGRRST